MRGAWGLSRIGRGLSVVALVLTLGSACTAQDGLPEGLQKPAGQVLVLDQDRLFQQSRFGQASLARESDAARALEAENNRILTDLIAEEQALTTRRATLPPAEFTALADAFDAKAERIRTEQDAKLDALVKGRDADRTAFLRAIGPIIGQLMREKGAAAILDASTVILFSPAFDITDEATQRVDAVLPPPAPTAVPEITPVPDASP